MPFAIASMAALAIGGAALFASSSPDYQFITNGAARYNKQTARSMPDEQQQSSLRTLQKSIDYYEE